MKNETKQGVLVVGHGSRREEANEDVRHAARLIGERGGFPLIEAAFLEIESPTIIDAFDNLVRRGADSIIVHPYFLSPGRHTRGDIPKRVAEAAAFYPDVDYLITEPLSAHTLVIEASIGRIRQTYGSVNNFQSYQPGKIYLVGAGPGDPGLLTLRAAELLRISDVVVYDYLVNAEILKLASNNADLIYAGKIGRSEQTSQSEINHLLIDLARQGKNVVRLKGGDPFIFGRGGEEANAIREAGLEFEVVPGISSALAAPAYAGISLTHRGLSSSVAVVTGARQNGKANRESLAALAKGADTVVILMGLGHLREIADELIESGRLASTPAAVISRGTYKDQKTVIGTLGTIACETEKAGLRSPAMIVVGEVVGLHEQLNWFEADAENSQLRVRDNPFELNLLNRLNTLNISEHMNS